VGRSKGGESVREARDHLNTGRNTPTSGGIMDTHERRDRNNRHHTGRLRRTLMIGATAPALLALGISPGAAVAASPSATPSPVTSSPATAVPTDASGAPVITPDQRIDPYVRSSIVYVDVDWRAWLYDMGTHTYLVHDAQGNGLATDIHVECTGYVVNPDGWIGTAGHCVSPQVDNQAGHSIHDMFVNEATRISLRNGYFDQAAARSGIRVTPAVAHAYWERYLRTEPKNNHSDKPDRLVTCYWGANVSGIEVADKGAPARVMQFQQFNAGDAALLKVNQTDMNALLLVPGDNTVDVGTSIASIGYAGSVQNATDADFHPSVKTGTVSSQKTTGDIPVYEIDASVTGGMSGGPTVNDQGQVIGTNSFGIRGETQAFNFVGTSQRMLELMNAQGVTNELSQDTQDMRAGLDAYFAGDRAKAIALLNSVHQSQPANDVVTEYLGRAKALPIPPEKTSGGLPAALWLVFVTLLLAAATAGTFLLLRNRRKHAAEPTYQAAQTAMQQPHVQPPPQPYSQVVTGSERVTEGTTAQPGEPVRFVAPSPPGTAEGEPMTTVGYAQPVVTADPVCGTCGQQAAPGQRFCGNCGASVGQPVH
jgi:serine protease Do